MDVELEEPVSGKKRVLDEPLEGDTPKEHKKLKTQSVRNIRKQLQTLDKISALKEFTSLIATNLKHDYIFDYLKDGGNCLELLQTLEGDSTIPPAIVFNLISKILLKISANYGQYYHSAYEACRYLINNYLPVIHKMIGLSSSKDERKVCLKLLTSMVTFSSNLGKDILLNVKFHSANIELLTKHTEEIDGVTVRDCFIQFLTSFLVDADWHNLSILIEKSGLLTSIIAGLQYDNANTVCLVITALKNNILENSAVKKTAKMTVFSTPVMKDIVNLYNWKGLAGLKLLDKNNKGLIIEVDKLAKSKVSECVHDLLLVLCTSYKHGLIFSDHLVGLGRKNLNGLMYTVLDSLDRPWEHSYAKDLVLKICRACPDLTKNMWLNLKPFIEPRLTEKWLNTINFAHKLLDEITPQCIDYCVKSLSAQQLGQIILMLISPSPILNIILDEKLLIDTAPSDKTIIKIHIIKLLLHMLKSVNEFLNNLKSWAAEHFIVKVKEYLANFLIKNYPKPEILLAEWSNNNEHDSKEEHLSIILDIFNFYKLISPNILSNLSTSNFDFKEFFFKLSENSNSELMQIKLVNVFIDMDEALFLPKTEIFSNILQVLLKNYHATKDKNIHKIIFKLLNNTGIFGNNSYEANIWINGIFNLKKLPDSFAQDFIKLIQNCSKNMLDYQKELNDLSESEQICDNSVSGNFMEIFFNATELSEENVKIIKPRILTPLILGLLKHCEQQENQSKILTKYTEYILINLLHTQTNWNSEQLKLLILLIRKYNSGVPTNINSYLKNWEQNEPMHIVKIKGSLEFFQIIGETFLQGTLEPAQFELSLYYYEDIFVDILRMCTFYLSNLLQRNLLQEIHVSNWIFIIHYIGDNKPELLFDEYFLQLILEESCIIKEFKVSCIDAKSSSFLISETILKLFQYLREKKISTELYTSHYSMKIFNNIMKYLKNHDKHSLRQDTILFLKEFSFSYTQCLKIITKISQLLFENIKSEFSMISGILIESFRILLELYRNNVELEPIEKNVILRLSTFLTTFNQENQNCGQFSIILMEYFQLFPFSIAYIDENLFASILNLTDYNKECVDLALFLLERNFNLIKVIEDNLSIVCEKKGVILPIVNILSNKNDSDEILENIYQLLESSIIKALQKPQKVGQHFLKNYNINSLIEKFMPMEKCLPFAEKVQKFEVVEPFHVSLLETCFNKIIDNNADNKHLNNIILTLSHLEISILKRKNESENDDTTKLCKVSETFDKILSKIDDGKTEISVNETVKSFCKFALKFGISGTPLLLTILNKLIKLIRTNLTKDEGALLLDMLISHSEFLNVVLGENSATKFEILSIFLTLCENFNDLMEKTHLAILLAAYKGMVNKCDRTVLIILKLYESKPDQTRFYDYKPFLWGRAAAIHYSVRSKIENSLNRQPKFSDILAILKEDVINSTIISYPLKDDLEQMNLNLSHQDLQSYDLNFFLPLFSHILAPEQQVKTYLFIRSGALSLTVLGLACEVKEMRQAACHVLSRLYFHLEARQTGKDNLLWIRFIEALCKGVALLPNLKLNSFSAIFFARMALILTNPKHVMFAPLSFYLTAKEDLNFGTVPELNTLLFSSDVNFKNHRSFILEILKDGMKSEKDFTDFQKSMGFKLFSELYSSCLSDAECKLLILDVICAISKLPLGIKILIENYALMPQLSFIISDICNHYTDKTIGLSKLLEILLNILRTVPDNKHVCFTVLNICDCIITTNNLVLKAQVQENFYHILYLVSRNLKDSWSIKNKKEFVRKLTVNISDRFCNYVIKYGSNFVQENYLDSIEDRKLHYLRLLVYKMLS